MTSPPLSLTALNPDVCPSEPVPTGTTQTACSPYAAASEHKKKSNRQVRTVARRGLPKGGARRRGLTVACGGYDIERPGSIDIATAACKTCIVVSRDNNSTIMLLWVGSRCWMSTKANTGIRRQRRRATF